MIVVGFKYIIYIMLKNILFSIITFTLLFSPSLSFGQENVPDSAEEVAGVFYRIAGIMQTFLFILAALFIIIAGYKYLFAKGDPNNIEDAKKMVIYTVVAVVVGLIAGGVAPFVEGFL